MRAMLLYLWSRWQIASGKKMAVRDSHLDSQLDRVSAVSAMETLWLFVSVAWLSLANKGAQ